MEYLCVIMRGVAVRHCEDSLESEAINDVGLSKIIDCFRLLCRLAMTFHSPLLIDSNVPTTARNVYVRAERHNIYAALWTIDIIPA